MLHMLQLREDMHTGEYMHMFITLTSAMLSSCCRWRVLCLHVCVLLLMSKLITSNVHSYEAKYKANNCVRIQVLCAYMCSAIGAIVQ
jgi:hypothetical protein